MNRAASYPAHDEAPEVVGAATITATCSPRRGRRLAKATALREALPAFLNEQVKLRNLREFTVRAYKNRLAT